MNKINKIILIVTIIAIVLVAIGGTYAFFTALITGNESNSTILVTGGKMTINYDNLTGLVEAFDIYPRDEAWVVKEFTVTGTNTTDLEMKYSLSLDIDVNTFTFGALTYSLTSVNTSGNGEVVKSQSDIPVNNESSFGIGKFLKGENQVHTYRFELFFKDNGKPQNENQESSFAGHIVINETTAPDDIVAPSIELLDASFAQQYFKIYNFEAQDFPLTLMFYAGEDETAVYEENNLINTVKISKSGQEIYYTQNETIYNSVRSIELLNDEIQVELNYSHANEDMRMYIGAKVIDAAGNIDVEDAPLPVAPAIGCFVAGTKVQTAKGLVNIEDIRLGDMVYSFDFETNQKILKPVKWVQETRFTNDTYTIVSGNEKIVTTYEHPFYVIDKGWVSADNLAIGDKLIDINNNEMIIDEIIYTKLEKPIQVYNFTVFDVHNYFVGNSGVLVHNISK